MNRACILVGGICNLLLGVFHLFFPWLFHWSTELKSISEQNQALVYALSYHCTLVITGFGIISLLGPREMYTTRVGKTLSAVIASFYLLRAAEELTLFRNAAGEVAFFLTLCLAIAAAYAYPLLRKAPAEQRALAAH